MTFDEAMLQARRRWGDRGVVEVTFTGYVLDGKVSYRYAVGDAAGGHSWNVQGQGETWEAAFEQADPTRRKKS